MNEFDTVPVLKPQNDSDRLLTDSLKVVKELKLQNKEELMLMAQTLKDKNQELKFAKQDNKALIAQIDAQQNEFAKFRQALKDLRSMAKEGALTYDVLHGPELLSFSKQIEKLKQMNSEARQKVQKLEDRCQAMSAQIIDKQKRINSLETKLLSSEEKRSYVEGLIQKRVKPAKEKSVAASSVSKKDVMDWFKSLPESIQNLPEHIPGWLKT